MMAPRPLILGLGSPHGDDQAGWLVVGELHERGWDKADARMLSQPVDLLDCLPTNRRLLLCDAAAGKTPGYLRTWIWPEQTLPTLIRGGTHDLTLAEVLEYAQELKLLDTSVELRTIDGVTWTPFSTPCDAVRDAADLLATQIHKEEAIHA
ncbi:MAG: hypothetical protein U0903_03810 [Planctomycetales bacterium]